MRALTSPVILTSASTRADGSLGLRFATPELAASEKTAFFELLNKNLKMLLQPEDSDGAELKEVKAEFENKTPCQRLRATLFVVWKTTDGTGEFEMFYRNQMEKLINQFKAKLPQE